jgi:hypothetical protein
MPEEKVAEPKEESQVEVDMDKILDDFEAGKQEDGSASKEPETVESEEESEAGADQSKKATEESEEEAGKVVDPKDLAFRKAYNEGRQKTLKEIGMTREEIDDLKKTMNSREYIEQSMRTKGFTQEAIDGELTKRGFEVAQKPGDDVGLVISKLGLDPKSVDENTRATISDVAKVVDILINDRLGKTLPKTMKPFEDNLISLQRKENASNLSKNMREIVEKDGVLDFAKDVYPEIVKFLEANKEAKQEDVFEHFKEVNHRLTIERLKAGKKQVGRDEEKGKLPKVFKPSGGKVTVPEKTGDADKDMDNFLDAIGYHE